MLTQKDNCDGAWHEIKDRRKKKGFIWPDIIYLSFQQDFHTNQPLQPTKIMHHASSAWRL